MKLIEIIIALILVYALFSILTSILVEFWNSEIKTRGKMIKKIIYQMLDDPLNLNYGALLMNHPLVDSMRNKLNKRPFQYLDGAIFADAFIDIICQQLPSNTTVNTTGNKNTLVSVFNSGIKEMDESPFKRMLELMSLKAGDDYKALKESIEDWYNRNNDRATGWYKRKQRWLTLVMGTLVAFALNVDSIHLYNVISMDKSLRDNLVQASEKVALGYDLLDTTEQQQLDKQIALVQSAINSLEKDTIDTVEIALWYQKTDTMLQNIKLTDSVSQVRVNQAREIIGLSANLRLPVGYSSTSFPRSRNFKDSASVKDYKPFLTKTELGRYLYQRNYEGGSETYIWWILGILITGFMLSFGAPFWFELLVKFVNIRKAGIKPEVKKPKK